MPARFRGNARFPVISLKSTRERFAGDSLSRQTQTRASAGLCISGRGRTNGSSPAVRQFRAANADAAARAENLCKILKKNKIWSDGRNLIERVAARMRNNTRRPAGRGAAVTFGAFERRAAAAKTGILMRELVDGQNSAPRRLGLPLRIGRSPRSFDCSTRQCRIHGRNFVNDDPRGRRTPPRILSDGSSTYRGQFITRI